MEAIALAACLKYMYMYQVYRPVQDMFEFLPRGDFTKQLDLYHGVAILILLNTPFQLM